MIDAATVAQLADLAGTAAALAFALLAVREMSTALRECRESQAAMLQEVLRMLSEHTRNEHDKP